MGTGREGIFHFCQERKPAAKVWVLCRKSQFRHFENFHAFYFEPPAVSAFGQTAGVFTTVKVKPSGAYSGQSEPPIPVQSEPVIPEQSEPPFGV
jgi:hypothetical protein